MLFWARGASLHCFPLLGCPTITTLGHQFQSRHRCRGCQDTLSPCILSSRLNKPTNVTQPNHGLFYRVASLAFSASKRSALHFLIHGGSHTSPDLPQLGLPPEPCRIRSTHSKVSAIYLLFMAESYENGGDESKWRTYNLAGRVK